MMGLSIFLLFGLALWAVYAVGIFSYQNGFIALMQQVDASLILPSSGEPLMTEFTDTPVIDEIVRKVIPFFYVMVDGSSPGLTLQAFNFMGEVVAVWALVCVESLRTANKGTLVAFPLIFGILAQTCTFALTMPIYTAIHLLISPSAQLINRSAVSAPSCKLRALPLSLAAGVVVPSVLMFMPETSSGILRTRQERIVFWQTWPVYVSIVQLAAGTILPAICQSKGLGDSSRKTRSSLRQVYSFALACTALPHISTWTISLASLVVPTLFKPEVLPALHPAHVFLNKLPWSSATASSVSEGTLWLSQYDHLVSAVAVLIWSITLWRAAHAAQTGRTRAFGLALKMVVMCLVAGVTGAAVEILWERDELLLEGAESQEPQEKKVK